MTRICTLSSDRALNAQTTSFSIPETCVGIVNESTMICDGYVVAGSPRVTFIADLLDVSPWLFLLFVPFRRWPTLSGHRLIWDLAEAISDHVGWLCARLSYEWPIDGLCRPSSECCR